MAGGGCSAAPSATGLLPQPSISVPFAVTPSSTSAVAAASLTVSPAASPDASASPAPSPALASVSAQASAQIAGSLPSAASPRAVTPLPTRPKPPAIPPLPADAYVDVVVATLWRSPSSPRSVDAPALRAPAGVREWLSAMTLAQRRALNGRVDSQLILGERVVVDRIDGSWAHVVVPDQPTPLDARGYPGWIPLAQLSFRAASSAPQQAVVTVPTAWIYVGGQRLFEASMGSRLPVLGIDASWVRSELPDGHAVSLRVVDVALVARGAAPFARSGADVVRTGHLFDGLAYLWGGTSGFGFDCSGFTHLVYAMRGVTIPRDADAQAVAGTPVARADLQPGDLVFFATSTGYVHHVGIYVGGNMMLNAPQTGSVVSVVSLSAQPFASEYAGARRYLGP